jgi:hypothetical protein
MQIKFTDSFFLNRYWILILALKVCLPVRALSDDTLRSKLSSEFASNCAGCHGAKGQGKMGPKLKKQSFQEFQYSVRYGKSNTMPAFEESDYSDTSLKNDFTELTGQPAVVPPKGPVDLVGVAPESSPKILYRDVEPGPQSRGLGFVLDPFVMPYVICKMLPNPSTFETSRVCANAGISGSAPEGYRFADFNVCRDVYTQRPYRDTPVLARSGLTDEEFLADPEFMRELDWITKQVRSSGCACCHDSTAPKKAAYWDVAQGRVWTNQLSKYAVAAFAGKVDSAAMGAYPPADNFGFNRYHTALPTTDVVRMQTFFNSLLSKMGATEDEISLMPPLGSSIAKQLTTESKSCQKGIGIDRKTGKVNWGLAPARYLYVLKPDSQNPVVTPNLDKPLGLIWRIDTRYGNVPFLPGSVTYGKVPKNSDQTVPDPLRFPQVQKLEEGKSYKLVAQLDIGFPVQNCVFKY